MEGTYSVKVRVRQMVEAVPLVLGLFSALIFLAHAVEAYFTA